MDDSKASMASSSSDDSNTNVSFSTMNLQQEKDPLLPDQNSEGNYSLQKSGFSTKSLKEKPRIKRSYNKKNKLDRINTEKPAPKKRGRKSKKDIQLTEKKSEYAQEFQPTFKKIKVRSPSQQKSQKVSRKGGTGKPRKSSGHPTGPSVFDKKILAGPHLTMKQVLEYILTDHSYCVPPDPLPAVGSNHQMIRYILGPKNGAKPKGLSTVGMLETGERSPLIYPNLSRSRTQLSMSSTPPPSSKLENLLKRSESSPLQIGGGSLRFSHSKHASDCRDEDDGDIDVESVDPEPEKRVSYDVHRAKEVMVECEKYVEFARGADTGDNWEAKIVRTGWTKPQSLLFDKVVGSLHAERLARLTYESAGDTEPILRRASLDRTACRVRRIFGEYLWDSKLTQWLHSVLTEFLNFAYLAIYMDVLQTLKAQCPHLISRMMKLSIITPLQSAFGRDNELQDLLLPYLDEDEETQNDIPNESELGKDTLICSTEIKPSEDNTVVKTGENEIYLPAKSIVPQVEDAMMQLHSAKNAEAFKTLLDRQWDPYAPDLMQRVKRLSSNPIFLVIAPGAVFSKSSLSSRLKQYHRMFHRIGKIVKVRLSSHDAFQSTSPLTYLERTISLAKEKIREVRRCFPERPLYLVGWGSGSILAARLSVTTGPVDGIVALGFPLHSLREMQDDVLKIFGGIKHPILFVIGGLASNNNLTDMELFRRRLACETSLVVIGSANDNLYVSRDHREKLLITQSYVNKTVMDEVAYFVNLHSKHNQIIGANISMKPHQFAKSQANSEGLSKKSTSLLRGKKRKSSFTDMDRESFASHNADSRDSFDSDGEKRHETSNPHSKRRERDLDSVKHSGGSYDYGFDGPKLIPSNKSSNKRKAYYRPDMPSTPSSITSSSCITASKLLQQSPNAKRRMSKPSGPTHRVPPIINQPPTERPSGGMMDISKNDRAAFYKYLSTGSTLPSDLEKGNSNVSSTYPLVLSTGGDKLGTGAPSYLGKDGNSDKTTKRKSGTKAKGSRTSKTNTSASPASTIVSALSEVTSPSIGNIASSTPPSSLDMHKFVVQHKQMIKQFEQNQQDRPQSSQLFKLLSPGAESSNNINISCLSTSASSGLSQGSSTELVNLKLCGSHVGPEVTGETRTAVISKQNLVSNMSLPMIRLSRPAVTEENTQQKPSFVTGSSTTGSTVLANLSADGSERIIVRTSDKSLMKLNAADLQKLIETGRGIQLFTGMPNQGPVNIILKKQPDSFESSPSLITTTSANIEAGISSVSATHQFVTPSLVIPVTDTTKSYGDIQLPGISQVEATKLTSDYTTGVVSTESKVENVSADPLIESEPMELDTEEEMSGLMISSTFSVCPTSGERVLPAPVALCSNDSETAPVPEKAADPLSNLGIDALTNDEVISVPIIQVQTPCTDLIENATTLQQDAENEKILPLGSEDAVEHPLTLTTSSTEASKEDTPKSNKKSVSSHSVSASECTPKTVLDNSGTLLKPTISITDEPQTNPAQTIGISGPTEKLDLPVSSVVVQVQNAQNLPDPKTSATSLSNEVNMPNIEPEPISEEAKVTNANSLLDPSESDEFLTVPILIKDPITATPVGSVTTASSEGSDVSTELPVTEEGKDAPDAESKASSSAITEEDKRKSKNNPVRRSARLKSGV